MKTPSENGSFERDSFGNCDADLTTDLFCAVASAENEGLTDWDINDIFEKARDLEFSLSEAVAWLERIHKSKIVSKSQIRLIVNTQNTKGSTDGQTTVSFRATGKSGQLYPETYHQKITQEAMIGDIHKKWIHWSFP